MGIMNTSTTQPGAYEIRVEGHLDERWGDWVDGVEIRHDADGTSTLTAQLADQPALHGVLGRMRDLGIPVVSVCRIDENGDASALMRAAAQYRYGDPMEVIEVRNIERPTVGADEVLVRVHAAGVDAGVWHLVSGQPYLLRTMGFGFRRPKNPVAGMDVAGTVEAVGSAVTRFQPGDEVFGCADGSFAEYATAKEAKLALKPANLTFEQAAAVPNSAAAALIGAIIHFDEPTIGLHRMVIEQGMEMGRPSCITVEMDVEHATLQAARIGGHAVKVAEGTLFV